MDAPTTTDIVDAEWLPPIIVDIDGILLRSRAVDEVVFQHALELPSGLTLLPRALVGMIKVGDVVPAGVELDASIWPANIDFVEYLTAESEKGREIVLATSADRVVADAIKARFPFITREMRFASGSTASEKAVLFREAFPQGFIYAGRAADDLEIWRAAHGGIAVNAPRSVLRRLADHPDVSVHHELRSFVSTFRKTLRLHQWAKNALIFVPLVLGGKMFDLLAWVDVVIGFFALGLVASGTYIINDLVDLSTDRRHWHKRYRPLAFGEVSVRTGLILAAICLLCGFGLAAWEGGSALGLVALYLVITLSYSFYWKRVPIVDVTVLAALYTLRLGLGMAVADVTVSSWLLVFSMFVFLSLSLAKRHTEVLRMAEKGSIAGRGYVSSDGPITLGLGLSSTMAAVLIMVVFLSEDVFNRPQYVEPQLLWVFPPILFLFLGRVWLLTHRGEMHDDPVSFALKDRTSVMLGGIMSLSLLLALTGLKIW